MKLVEYTIKSAQQGLSSSTRLEVIYDQTEEKSANNFANPVSQPSPRPTLAWKASAVGSELLG